MNLAMELSSRVLDVNVSIRELYTGIRLRSQKDWPMGWSKVPLDF